MGEFLKCMKEIEDDGGSVGYALDGLLFFGVKHISAHAIEQRELVSPYTEG